MRNKIIEEDLKFITSLDIPWERLEGKNILVSGANGFLPSYIVETILFLNEFKFKSKANVFALIRNLKKGEERFEEYLGRDDLEFIVQDVCNPVRIDKEIHFIIHAASQASPKYYGIDPVGTLSANVIGTRNLLELAREKKVESFLYFSSGAVYGQVSDNQIPTKENEYGHIDPLNINSCYAESKRMGETMCISWFHQYNIPVKIVRPFNTFGPKMKFDDGRVHADFVADIVNNKNIAMKSNGSDVRNFCYIADSTAGFFTILLKGKNGEAYNIGNESGEKSIIELANMIIGLVPEKRLKVEINKEFKQEEYLKSEVKRYCPDLTKIRGLGWKPCYSIEEGFLRTIKSYQDGQNN